MPLCISSTKPLPDLDVSGRELGRFKLLLDMGCSGTVYGEELGLEVGEGRRCGGCREQHTFIAV